MTVGSAPWALRGNFYLEKNNQHLSPITVKCSNDELRASSDKTAHLTGNAAVRYFAFTLF